MKDTLIKNIDIITSGGVIEKGCIVINNGVFDYVGETRKEILDDSYNDTMDKKDMMAAPTVLWWP